MADYMTMKELGQRLGLSSHQVGKKLKEVGLRTPEGRPSGAAFRRKLVEQRWSSDGEHYLWAWDAERTLRFLANEPHGHSS